MGNPSRLRMPTICLLLAIASARCPAADEHAAPTPPAEDAATTDTKPLTDAERVKLDAEVAATINLIPSIEATIAKNQQDIVEADKRIAKGDKRIAENQVLIDAAMKRDDEAATLDVDLDGKPRQRTKPETDEAGSNTAKPDAPAGDTRPDPAASGH